MYGHVLLMKSVPQHCNGTIINPVPKLSLKLMMYTINSIPYELNVVIYFLTS